MAGKKSAAATLAASEARPSDLALEPTAAVDSQPYVGRWQTLISTTNWEKGRIICQWRDSLAAAGAPASEYSDEAWAQLVGGVSGQHVGRLRRVFQRFGGTCDRFPRLYWSHFQAALEWNDAEMWLEGAVHSDWSVAQMRNQRWETLGAVAADRPHDGDVVASEFDEDYEPAQGARPAALTGTLEAVGGEVATGPRPDGPDFGDDEADSQRRDRRPADEDDDATADAPRGAAIRPFASLPDLPDDLADAFESFKLAILRHKTAGWVEISQSDVLASLAALREMVLAPAAE